LAQRWPDFDPAERHRIVRTVLTRVELRPGRVDVHVSPPELRTWLLGGRGALLDGSAAPATTATAAIVLPVAAKFERAGKAMALVAAAGASATTRSDAALIRLVARGRALRDALAATDAASITAFARREGLSKSYVTRLARLAYLAPDIVTAIVEGRQPARLTAARLLEDTRLPLDWQEQRQALGFA
jgi:site-specific DNA recombinase